MMTIPIGSGRGGDGTLSPILAPHGPRVKVAQCTDLFSVLACGVTKNVYNNDLQYELVICDSKLIISLVLFNGSVM